MSTRHGHWQAFPRSHPAPVSKKARERMLQDVAEGLELSSTMAHLAESQWGRSGHSGRLPLQHILRNCAKQILVEVGRCRAELEATGRIRFGEVVLEEEDAPAVPDPQGVPPPWVLPREVKQVPIVVNGGVSQESALRASMTPLWMRPRPGPGPREGGLRRVWASFLTLPLWVGARGASVHSRQEGG